MRQSDERLRFGNLLSNDEILFHRYVDFETEYLRERVFEREGDERGRDERDEREVMSALVARRRTQGIEAKRGLRSRAYIYAYMRVLRGRCYVCVCAASTETHIHGDC